MKRIGTLLVLMVLASCSYAESDADCITSMEVKPLNLKGKKVAYQNHNKNTAEYIAVFENGDMAISRYATNCGLGFDISYFSKTKIETHKQKVELAKWLSMQFRDYAEHNTYISEQLNKQPEIKSNQFSFSIEGDLTDEEHYYRLTDILISNDIRTELFSHVMSYSWTPPSGE